MSQILEKLNKVDPNDSDAVRETISAFFQNVSNYTEVNCNVWLRALEDVITRFPRYCAQHRTTIENYLAHFLDSPNMYNVIEAAKCAHSLQQIRPSQDKAATAKNCWREQMSILCQAAHKLVEAIFSTTLDIYKTNRNEKEEATPLLGAGPLAAALRDIRVSRSHNTNTLDKNMLLSNKLRNIFIFIQAMLVEVFPACKCVRVCALLQVVSSALSASSGAAATAALGLEVCAPVQRHALRTLDALLCSVGCNVLPWGALVWRCVLHALRGTHHQSSDEARAVRCAAYATCARWAALGGAGGGVGVGAHSHHDEVVAHVARDVAPHTTHTPLQHHVGVSGRGKLGRAARRKLAALHAHRTAPHRGAAERSDDVAIAALECLETFLPASGALVSPAPLKRLLERLVRECYAAPRGDGGRVERALRVLHAARHTRRVGPHHLLHLYAAHAHAHAAHAQVRKFCSQALLDLKLQLHCAPPSLNFAPDLTSDNNNTLSKGVSRRNRDALEALLGTHRMTSSSDEVIMVPEEPSSKRPRLQEEVVVDNISVSSDSVHSVHGSDHEDDTVGTGGGEGEGEEGDTTATQRHGHTGDIHEAATQGHAHTHTEEEELHENSSLEVTYGTHNEHQVKPLDSTHDDNLPSTNDTDDVQITCGQVAQHSQELDTHTSTASEETAAVNGVAALHQPEREQTERVQVDVDSKQATVHDMLADFVDEPAEGPASTGGLISGHNRVRLLFRPI